MWWTTRSARDPGGEPFRRWTTHTSVSEDGLHFRYERGPEFASGPATNRSDRDLIRLPDGRWRAYTLVGGGNPWYCIDSFIGDPAAGKWTTEPALRINFGAAGDLDATGARGPEAVRLPDGAYRLYYLGWNGPEGPHVNRPGPDERWRVLSAISTDGLTFTKEPGVRMDVDARAHPPHGAVAMSKPLVVPLKDGRWRMYFSAAHAGAPGATALFSAVSGDGLTWQREAGVRLVTSADPTTAQVPVPAANPTLVRTADGRLRLYYDGADGIRSGVTR
jgi:hypothetical protein